LKFTQLQEGTAIINKQQHLSFVFSIATYFSDPGLTLRMGQALNYRPLEKSLPEGQSMTCKSLFQNGLLSLELAAELLQNFVILDYQ
jgi:hypothetical protein